MRVSYLVLFIGLAVGERFPTDISNAALFYRQPLEFGAIKRQEKRSNERREAVPGQNVLKKDSEDDMDETVKNLLAWLQDRYTNSNRRTRQEKLTRNYLPALLGSTTQQPRPFQPSGYPASPDPSPAFQLPSTEGFRTVPPSYPPPPEGTQPSSPGYDVTGGTPNYSPTAGTYPPQPLDDDPSKHPPHIHNIDVKCSKEKMIIDIQFNTAFNGVIYSKGFYNSPNCRYVEPNSGRTEYSFTVMLDSCGTQFVDQFSEGKQAYLENVLVLQNEPGIQEVWDTIRSVRCLWEGSISKALSVALSVGTLSQEIVTFSGDTASASLDIQVGRGPFAPGANGLVKIGETMTLVVRVEGDPGFGVAVKSCLARDNDPQVSANVVQLTDDEGCVLRPKLLGAFQETRDPNSQAVIAYAFFQAFKFPDVMDLTIECNVELCKTQCNRCQDPNQKTEPGRRKRSAGNSSESEPVTLGKKLMVFLPQDVAKDTLTQPTSQGVCFSTWSIVLSSVLIITTLVATLLTMALLCRTKSQKKSQFK